VPHYPASGGAHASTSEPAAPAGPLRLGTLPLPPSPAEAHTMNKCNIRGNERTHVIIFTTKSKPASECTLACVLGTHAKAGIHTGGHSTAGQMHIMPTTHTTLTMGGPARAGTWTAPGSHRRPETAHAAWPAAVEL